MVSFIIISSVKDKREKYIKDFAAKESINRFDMTLIEKETDTKTTNSIGIETVKMIQKKLFLKPIKSKNKLLVIEDAAHLTPEAQNALLKVLEEPPANTFIFLGIDRQEKLLPTILSRCQIITLDDEQKKVSDVSRDELNEFIDTLPNLSLGEKLKQAETLAKDKDKAIDWIENLIIVLREKLIETYIISKQNDNKTLTFDTPDTLNKLQSLHTILKTTNVNPRFAIEHTLLSI